MPHCAGALNIHNTGAVMPKPILSHALDKEFPQLADKTRALKGSDTHFAHMLTQHDQLDARITESEAGRSSVDDFALEDLKKQRLHLKDKLYRMLTGT
ncbi:MAG: hypothetical protein RL341_1641 [Pseudomonadota bacterium]